jgi:hypothetical protein
VSRVSRTQGRRGRRTQAAAILVVASALVLLGAACAGGGKSDGKHGKKPKLPPNTLPSGGIRQTLHAKGASVLAVVYGGSGEIKADQSTLQPHAGNHFTAVKIGLKNMGPKTYRVDLTRTASIVNDEGKEFGAVDLGSKGLGKIVLKNGTTAYGRVFFELGDETRLQSVRLRPSPAAKASAFVIRGGSNESKASTKPLPSGGIARILRGARGEMIKAVVYGGSSVENKAIGLTPLSGNHFLSVKVGIKNFGSRPYAVSLIPSTAITNTEDKLFRAIDAGGHGMVRVALAHGQTAYGRIFFQLADGTRLRSVRFRPFGPKTKVYSFIFRGG